MRKRKVTRKVTQKHFDKTIARAGKKKSFRGQLYPVALNLLAEGRDLEAYLLILATWNFAAFRYVMKTFDFNRFCAAIAATKPCFARLEKFDFKSADFDALAEDVKGACKAFHRLAKQTGTSKIMHFKQPRLFVMWDTDIRRYYGFRSSPVEFLEFQKRMQSEFGNLRWTRLDKTFARAIDEYNYIRAHAKKKKRSR